MSGFLERLGAAFLVDSSADRWRERHGARVVAAPPAVGVLCRADEAWAVGGAVALAAARTGVVAVWCGAPRPALRAPSTPAARRLAAVLARRDHAAVATGRLVQVRLTGSSAEACAEAARVAAAAGDAACVVVLAGPRDARVDSLLRAQDRVVIHGDAAVTELALASVTTLGVPAELLSLGSASSAARVLAAAGVRAPKGPGDDAR